MKLIIPGKLPGLNELIDAERTHRIKGAELKADAERIVRLCIRQQLKHRPKLPVRLHYTYYEKDRRRDKDNIAGFAHKVVQDSLVKQGILPNDGWNEISGFTDSFAVDRKNPRIEIEIEEGVKDDQRA